MRIIILILIVLLYRSAFAGEEGQVDGARLLNSRWSSTYWASFSKTSLFESSSYSEKSANSATTTNALFLNYKISSNLVTGLVFAYEWAPAASNKSFLYNPTVRIGRNGLISTEALKLFSDLRFTLPLNSSRDLQDQKVLFGIRTTHIAHFRTPGSRFWISSLNWYRFQWFGQAVLGKKMQFYSRSTFNYDHSDILASSLILIGSAFVTKKEPGEVNLETLRLGLGTQIKLANEWTVSPYLTTNMTSLRIEETGIYLMTQAAVF